MKAIVLASMASFGMFSRKFSRCAGKKEEDEEIPTTLEEQPFRGPILNAKRIVVVGDGDEASLTAFLLARDRVIQHYQYKIFLIMGGRGVQQEYDEAKSKYSGKLLLWMPQKLRFITNYMLFEGFRSKLFERHFIKFLKYKFFPPQINRQQTEEAVIQSIDDKVLRSILKIDEKNEQLTVLSSVKESEEIKDYMKNHMKNNVTIVRGQVRFIHPFGEYVGECEIDDCKDMKGLRSDYYILCNTFHLPTMMRYIKQTVPVLRSTKLIYDCSEIMEPLKSVTHSIMSGPWIFFSPDSNQIVGRSMRFKNLFYNLGVLDGNLDTYIRNALMIRNELVAELRQKYRNPESQAKIIPDSTFPQLRPSRFHM